MKQVSSSLVTPILFSEMIWDRNGTTVTGGHGWGTVIHQFKGLSSLFFDHDQNHRVTAWTKDARLGEVVAGGNGQDKGLTQLNSPSGLWVDRWGQVYVADTGNARVMRWERGATKGMVLVGRNERGANVDQLDNSKRLSFDRHSQFYVADDYNFRIQCFSLVVVEWHLMHA